MSVEIRKFRKPHSSGVLCLSLQIGIGMSVSLCSQEVYPGRVESIISSAIVIAFAVSRFGGLCEILENSLLSSWEM